MRRSLIVLLTLLMLVQSTWAAMAVCCLDEAMGAGAVIEQGHDQSPAASDAAHASTLTDESQRLCDVGHCHCHHACAAFSAAPDMNLAIAPRASPPTALPDAGASHIPDGLDRPNWQRA